MILLTVIAVGLLTLSAITLRSASQSAPLAEARANARMAMMLALGELQKEAGPDQRITAAAAVMAKDGSGRGPDAAAFDARTLDTAFAQAQWLGTWDSWTNWLNNSGMEGTYQKGRSSKFRRWLVSHPQPQQLDAQQAAGNGFAGLQMIDLVGEGTVGKAAAPTARVAAPLVPVATSSKGGFAWWVTGNNQRALIRHNRDSQAPADTIAEAANRLADQPLVGLDWLENLTKVPVKSERMENCLTVPTLALTDPESTLRDVVKTYYHDLTGYSVGLPVNVRDGTLKMDLNLLLEMPTLPNEYGTYRRSVPGGTITPIREHQKLGKAPQYAQNLNFTSWYKLQQYYQLASGRAGGGNDETADDCSPVAFKKGLWWTGNTTPGINFNWERQNLDYYGWSRTPIISRLMIVFSLRRDASKTDASRFAYKMSYNPVVVVWNPYNITLHSPPLWMEFTPGSLQFKNYKNNVADGGWKPLARDAKSEGALGSGALFEVAIQQSARAATQPIVLKPGETRIFSAQGSVADTRSRIVLTPGYKAPTDNGGFDITLPGLDDVPAGTNIQLAMRLNDERPDHGGQYQMYWTVRNAATGESQRFNEVAANPVQDGQPLIIIEDKEGKRLSFGTNSTRLPFGSFEFVLKSGEDLRNGGSYGRFDARGKNFINSKPWNNRAMYGEATPRMKGMAQYDVHVAVGSGNQLNPDFEMDTNRGYIGSAISLGGSSYPGQTIAPMTEIPLVPPTSLAGFAHFRLNPGDTRDFVSGRHLWDISTNDALSIGSSFANPLIPGNAIYADVADAACRGSALQMKLIRDYYDHVFLNNDALWDRWFCSGAVAETVPAFAANRPAKQVVQEFFDGKVPLANSHYVIDGSQMHESKEIMTELFTGNNPKNDAHKMIARYLNIEGAFNVNSTSVEAWNAVLAGLRDESISYLDPDSGSIKSTAAPDDRVVLSRFSLPSYPTEGDNPGDPAAWGGVRLLTPEQIDRLARECVRQVKLRGPFLNMADFINRRLTNDETGQCGALQAAIDWDEFNNHSPGTAARESINGRYKTPDDLIASAQVSSWSLNFPKAGTGSRWTGIPGYLTQSDLLRRLGNSLAVRDDTFTIRTYGEARDAAGKITARAWCEVEVVRGKDFMDPTNPIDTPAAKLNPLNQRFGRRFEVVSFRWLPANEI